MFRRRADISEENQSPKTERISSVIADGVSLRGKLSGAGGVRIEGAFDGEINLDGLLVIGPSGRVTCKELKAQSVIVAGAMRGNILAERVEIRSTGRVWGDVITTAMSTQDGAFLRGQIQMEEEVAFEDPTFPVNNEGNAEGEKGADSDGATKKKAIKKSKKKK